MMAVIDAGTTIWLLCVSYILLGYTISDTILCLGGVVGLWVLKTWSQDARNK